MANFNSFLYVYKRVVTMNYLNLGDFVNHYI